MSDRSDRLEGDHLSERPVEAPALEEPAGAVPVGASSISSGPFMTAAPAIAMRDRLAPWSGRARTALRGLADFLLPPVCLSCRTPVDRAGQLCGACWAKIDFISAPLCDRLGVPLPFDTGETALSAMAIAKPPAYDRARAVAAYDATMRGLIQSFKYRDRHEGLPLFGRWLVQAGAPLLADGELLVPVPLHRSKLWARRFNQSALLAGEVSRLSGVPVAYRLLNRVRRTKSQVGLSADQRRRNVSGAFSVGVEDAGVAAGKKVLLIDDVITTGATMEACARVLRAAGASRVDALATARVVEPGVAIL